MIGKTNGGIRVQAPTVAGVTAHGFGYGRSAVGPLGALGNAALPPVGDYVGLPTGYSYRLDGYGQITILDGPTGRGSRVAPGTPLYNSIIAQLRAHPNNRRPLDSVNAQSTTPTGVLTGTSGSASWAAGVNEDQAATAAARDAAGDGSAAPWLTTAVAVFDVFSPLIGLGISEAAAGGRNALPKMQRKLAEKEAALARSAPGTPRHAGLQAEVASLRDQIVAYQQSMAQASDVSAYAVAAPAQSQTPWTAVALALGVPLALGVYLYSRGK